MRFDPELCSGSTADFDSVSISSILISGAKHKHTEQEVVLLSRFNVVSAAELFSMFLFGKFWGYNLVVK